MWNIFHVYGISFPAFTSLAWTNLEKGWKLSVKGWKILRSIASQHGKWDLEFLKAGKVFDIWLSMLEN